MSLKVNFYSGVIAAVLVFAAPGFWSTPAQAQGFFCPPVLPNGLVPSLQNGACTSGPAGQGAFSGAALATQALSDLAQSSAQETTRRVSAAVEERRTEEQARCPAGLVRIQGECRRPVRQTGGQSAAPAVQQPAAGVVADVWRLGAFVQGFGDYERRSGSGAGNVTYITNYNINTVVPAPDYLVAGFPVTPAGSPMVLPFTIESESRTTTGGVVAGIDFTKRGFIASGDGIILGISAGYTSTSVVVDTQTISLFPVLLDNGSSHVNARLEGPSLGLYSTYFNGPFSVDTVGKIDFLRLKLSFIDNLAFGGNGATAPLGTDAAPPPAFLGIDPTVNRIIQSSGSGSSDLTVLTASQNFNYRFPISQAGPTTQWIEPTAGYLVSYSNYGSNPFGLDDATLVRLQGGVKWGHETYFSDVLVKTTLTALAYSNVVVEGSVIAGGGFGANEEVLGDQGKLRGQAIINTVLEWRNGFSALFQADFRGGEDFYGYGGKAGVRYQW